jgi:poly(glycerol-phosphate) alpha-glucosyltransferase
MISPHGMLDPWALKHSGWKKRIASALYELGHLRRAACLHALCDAEYNAIRAFGLSNPVCMIPNGVDPVGRRALGPPPWRSELPEKANVLLYLGRLHPKKGLANLLKGWGELRRTGGDADRNWYLVIAGWDQGGHRASLEALVLREGIGGGVRFVGPQFGPDKEATFRSADAFVLPSFSEGLPIVVLEAWAHGLPVLMTPHCNLPEGFARRAALSIEPSPGSIAGQVHALLVMSDDRRREIGDRGRELASTEFNWNRIAAQLASVYRWISASGPRPDCVRLA